MDWTLIWIAVIAAVTIITTSIDWRNVALAYIGIERAKLSLQYSKAVVDAAMGELEGKSARR